MSDGNFKQSLLVVIIVTVQLLVSVAVARAVILLLLLTSGDVEQNPGPDYELGPALSAYSSELIISKSTELNSGPRHNCMHEIIH